MEPGESSSTLKPSRHMKNRLQLSILEAAYTVNKTPSAVMKEVVADMTGLTPKEVTAWYGNKRFCERHGPRRKKTVEVQVVAPTSVASENVGRPSTILMSDKERVDQSLQPRLTQSLLPIEQSQHTMQAHDVGTSMLATVRLNRQSLQLSIDPPTQKRHPYTFTTKIQQSNPDPTTMNFKGVGHPKKTKWIEPVRVYKRRKRQGIHGGSQPNEKETTARDGKQAAYNAAHGKDDNVEVIDLDSE